MIKISIILPIYNVEAFLSDCLDSLYEQDLLEEEYEIICIIDGSPDNSQAIVEKYIKKHSNIKMLLQDNCGVSVARNVGMKNSEGKYVWFIDPDDMIASNCLKTIYSELEKAQADIFELQYKTCDEKCGFIPEKIEFQVDGMNREEASGSGWLSVCRKEYLLRNRIVFNEELSYGEDYLWAFQTKYRKHKSIYTDKALYIYRQRNNSAMKANDPYRAKKHMDDMIKLYYLYGIELERCEKENMGISVLENVNRRRQQSIEGALICLLKQCLPRHEVKEKLDELGNMGAYPYKLMLWNLLGKQKGHSLKVRVFTFLFPVKCYYLFLCDLYRILHR